MQNTQHPDDAAVDALATAMKAKLAKQRAKGYGGWDTDCTQQRLSDMLRTHVEKGDPVDVANFCAFLLARGEAIAAAQQAVQPVAWAAVYFAGPRMGKIYTTCDTEQQCNAYIAQVHQSNDSITLTAKPIYTHPTQQGMDAQDAIRALIAQHGKELEKNEYAYFELAYTRSTGWMAWITDKPLCSPVVNPDRKVLASGQGDTPEAACAAALAAQAKQGGAANG